MADDGLELYLITDPSTENQADSNATGYLQDLLDHYQSEGAMAVRDIDDFVGRVLAASFMAGKKVTKLVIGSHGSGIDSGYGNFHIGKTVINTDPDDYKMLKQKLWPIRTVLAAHAHVYLLSCRTGKSTALLGGVSDALGGIAVHGFTDYISTLNLYVYSSVDDGTEDGGKEIVCWSNECVEVKTNGLRPFTNR